MTEPTKVLLFSTLYPSAVRPQHGIFVETRLRELLRTGQVQARVLAPVPWFPSTHKRFGAYAGYAATPAVEDRHGITVQHPRYALLPKIGMTIAPWLLALGAVPAVRRLLRQGFDFDVLDAHYLYPDGVAAALLARWFRKPFVITARGSDVNLIGGFALPRRMMVWAARRASAVVTVSEALARAVREWPVRGDRVHVLRNGIDLDRFKPVAMDEARASLGLSSGPLIVSVGNLVPLKQHHVALRALAALAPRFPGLRLAIIGDGPSRTALEAEAASLGVAERVRFTGSIPQEALPAWYSAADMLVLASTREGWPNVLLEAMACGAPVVASRVGGTPEIVTSPAVGHLVAPDDQAGFDEAIAHWLQNPADREAVRAHAGGMGWAQTSEGQLALFRDAVARR